MNKRSLTSCCTLAVALLLGACGPNKGDFGSLEGGGPTSDRYRGSLELPPDLVDTTSESILAAGQVEEETEEKVLPEIENLDIQQNDEEGWIEVNVDADVVWQKLVSHWNSLGVDLVEADPKTGVMVTDWVVPRTREEERREFLGVAFLGNVLDDLLGNLFDQATALDKYTIQLERKPQTHTRINVAHRGLVKIQTQQPTKKNNEKFEWVETDEQPDKVKRALTSIAYGLSGETS